MKDREDGDGAVVQKILELLGIEAGAFLGVRKGYRNASHPVVCRDGSTVNVIVYKHEPGIVERVRRADELSDALASHGLPVRRSISPVIKLAGKTQRRYARVYSYLPGETIAWEAYTMRHLKQVGTMMGDIHSTANLLEGELLVAGHSVMAENLALCARMITYFSDQPVQQAQATKLGVRLDPAVLVEFQEYLASEALRSLPQIPLHMDLVRGNILFADTADGPSISGIIDFEKAAYGPAVFDIARTLAFLLVDCKYKPADKIRKYFLNSGYIKYGGYPITKAELAPLDQLVTFYLLHDYYKFLRHNPYESLRANEHFVRTRRFIFSEK